MTGNCNKAYAISAVGHGVVLLWSVLSFAAKPLPVPPSEALPVDIVSVVRIHADDGGQQERRPRSKRKSRWSKRSQRRSRSRTRPPRWWRRKRSRPRARRRRRCPESKPAEPEKKATEAKPDQVAEALAKDEAKKPEPKKAEAKPPTPQKKPAPPAPKFDPKQVEALLDKRDSTRLAAAGDTLNNATSLGASSGASAQNLTQRA